MSAEQITDEKLCWEYIKYEIKTFSIHFSKEKAKKTRAKTVSLENRLKVLGQNLDYICDCNHIDYKKKKKKTQANIWRKGYWC